MESALVSSSRFSISFANDFVLPGTYNTIRSMSVSTPRTSRLHVIFSYQTQLQKPVSHSSIDMKPSPHLCFNRWPKHFDFYCKWVSGTISIFFLCLNFVGDALGDPGLLMRYACEDVSHYYARAKGMEGAALMKELNSIVSNHRSLPYKEVWNALKVLDAADVDDPEASSDVVEIYSLRPVSKSLARKPEGWNREHLWPRSYGLTEGPSLTDLHNIRPADVNVNSSRGNKYYGECASHSTDCMKPAYREAASDTETDKERWAPPLQVRGDIARSLMYMAMRYGISQSSGSPSLQLSDAPSMERREMGLLSALLRWNELDPPSRAERLRNDRICKLYQHNRNPFVDHPEYATLIWKHAIPSSPLIYGPSLKAWINEFHYKNKGKDQNEFVEVVVRQSTDATALQLVLYNGADGKMYKTLPLTDQRAFSVTNDKSGFLIFTAFIPLQNGPQDGIALISSTKSNHHEVIQFISSDGVVKAIDGPVKGVGSVDIKVHETVGSTKHDSLGLTGSRIGEFEWRKFVNGASPGKPNIGQNLSDT